MAEKKAKAAEQPKAEQPKDQQIDNSGMESLEGKTIDERMKALERDHKRMGAR